MNSLSKRTAITIIAVLLLAAGGAFALWVDDEGSDRDDVAITENGDDNGQDDESEDTDNGENGNGGDSNGSEPEGSSDDPQSSPEDEATEPSPETFSESITLNNFGQRSSGIFANAQVSGTTEGECRFVFTRGGNTVEETVSISQAPTGYYVCSLNMDADALSAGNWTAKAFLRGTDEQVHSQERSAEIQ